jgi:hypothetical protein
MLSCAAVVCAGAIAGVELQLHVRQPEASAASEAEHLGSSADGSAARPFRSLHAARDAIRLLMLAKPQRARGGIRITVHPGRYHALELTAADSGRKGAPVVWQAAAAALGATVITAGTEVPGSALKPWAERRGVWTADLRALGVTRYGNLSVGDTGTGNLGCGDDRVGLYYERQHMTLARFPNIDNYSNGTGTWNYATIDLGGDGTFAVSPEEAATSRLPLWVQEPNPWLHGYWVYSWDDGYVPLESATVLLNGFVNVSIGAKNGVVKPGARFYGVNLLSELDAPSEYYIDDVTSTLYFYPPTGAALPSQWAAGTLMVAVNDTAVNCTNVSHVVMRGLTMTSAVHTGIDGAGVDGVRIENCTVAGCGRHGIDLEGVNSGVSESVIHDVGGSGMRVVGGTAMTLAPGNMWAKDNHVHHIGLWKRTYQPALFWAGVHPWDLGPQKLFLGPKKFTNCNTEYLLGPR